MHSTDNNIKLIGLLVELLESDRISPETKEVIIEVLEGELDEVNWKKLGRTAALAGLIGTGTFLGGKEAKDRAYKNIYPYGYTTTVSDDGGKTTKEIGPLQRFYRAIILNQQETPRLNMEIDPSGFEKEKLDLWGMYLGKGQKHNTIADSKYKPSKGSGGGKYYSVPKLEQDYLNVGNIKAKDFSEFKSAFLKLADGGKFGDVIAAGEGEASQIQQGKRVTNIQPLGNATLSTGEDDKGYYISYYDVWDLNPLKGGSALQSLDNPAIDKVVKFFGMDKKEDLLGGETIEIYGRVYFDKETGNRLN